MKQDQFLINNLYHKLIIALLPLYNNLGIYKYYIVQNFNFKFYLWTLNNNKSSFILLAITVNSNA